ncbi:MAG: flavodoxin-dependent (E)-4-hydroxy-3-methylbut-2-enyl-diphosphate synthase [Spirochaetia bacterium]|nr:flavodoxin-dependent (E)-4-hydroxy-3-methylbut-2-enyl-diphosphate synthase [Spirochaetia bacterium]MCF7946339.1 flavodoxin-dependent (E)-4-hydroxy-3-methylbut-2-enyl-diphosphate synthase [Spirochaetia bacterium]
MRQKTKKVKVGSVYVGGNSSIPIQSMWSSNIPVVTNSLLNELKALKSIGCDLMRFSVKNKEDIRNLGIIQKQEIMPVIADIHFDYSLAIEAIKTGIPKIRINPGNIGRKWKTEEIIQHAQDNNTAVRVGVNSGSLPWYLRKETDIVQAMSRTVEEYIEIFAKKNFENLIISLKSSNPGINYQVNKDFAEKFDYPLHIGITEAGPLIPSLVKSTYALGRLLSEGIGDTIRISISDDIRNEVIAAKEILSLFNLIDSITIISCPRCGRATFDTHDFIKRVENRLYSVNKKITVAVMGCAVNGPEEAKHADLGITGIGDKVFIFKYGKMLKQVALEKAEKEFFNELDKL